VPALRPAWLGVAAAMLLGALWTLTPIAAPLDGRALDASFALLTRLHPMPAATDLAIVGLDEATLAAVPEPLALIHPHLGAVLEALAQGGARAVALDLVLPDRSFDSIAPGADLALMRGLLAMRRAGVLVLARTVDDGGLERTIHAPLLAAAGPGGSGFALLPVDRDGAVRRIDERLGADGAAVATMVGELARRLGHRVEPGLIDYSRPIGIEPISVLTVLGWTRAADTVALRRAFAGKVVFVGALLPFVDRHRVPVALGASGYLPASMPGVFLQAQAFSTLASRGALPVRPAPAMVLAAVLCGIAWRFALRWRPALGIVVVGLVVLALASAASLAAGFWIPVAAAATALLACATVRYGLELRADVAARRRLRRLFGGYVSPDVMTELEAGRLDGMTSQRRFICVMFIDVRGFTTRVESSAPERVTALLNTLFETATEVVHAHGGTVKEFMGDGVMAFFGAPRALPNPGQAGFDAARAMLAALSPINAEIAGRGEAPLTIGIGLASGEAVVGHIGSATRHTYGAIGDCVNLASRLEGLTKTLGHPLLMSASVQAAIDEASAAQSLGEHAIKGHTPVAVFGWR
jgi:adenylate cyclase